MRNALLRMVGLQQARGMHLRSRVNQWHGRLTINLLLIMFPNP